MRYLAVVDKIDTECVCVCVCVCVCEKRERDRERERERERESGRSGMIYANPSNALIVTNYCLCSFEL